jgi:putative endonuclease
MREGRSYYVYILASKQNGTLYTGITNSLVRRIQEHKTKYFKGFTKKYEVDKLVYYEIYGSPGDAIRREKCIKKWNREWKLRLIEKDNPTWKDLSVDLF